MLIESKTTDELLQRERQAIRQRRSIALGEEANEAASLSGQVGESQDERQNQSDTFTGLALSGGGVRAASFSLGFLQSLYRCGRMRGIDYMSTVSGGGYAGAFFCAQVMDRPKVNWDRMCDGDHPPSDRLDFEPNADGSQPDSVKRLMLHGRLMGNLLLFFSRHFWGLLVNSAFVVSGLIAIGALLALAMRSVWSPSLMDVTAELGFRTDITKPFFYAFLAALVWIASHSIDKGCRLLGKQIFPITRYTYLLLMALLALGFLTMLAISDVGIAAWVEEFDFDPHLERRLTHLFGALTTGMSAVVLAMLIPYLSPKKLLESGKADAARWQHVIFHFASNGLVIGVPLVIFFFLAHENISGATSNREQHDQLHPAHVQYIARWIPALEGQMASESTPKRMVASRLLAAMRQEENDGHGVDAVITNKWNANDGILGQYLELDQHSHSRQQSIHFLRRWREYIASYFVSQGGHEQRMSDRQALRDLKKTLTQEVNHRVLSDPQLFTEWMDITAEQSKAANSSSLLILGLRKNVAPAANTIPNSENLFGFTDPSSPSEDWPISSAIQSPPNRASIQSWLGEARSLQHQCDKQLLADLSESTVNPAVNPLKPTRHEHWVACIREMDRQLSSSENANDGLRRLPRLLAFHRFLQEKESVKTAMKRIFGELHWKQVATSKESTLLSDDLGKTTNSIDRDSDSLPNQTRREVQVEGLDHLHADLLKSVETMLMKVRQNNWRLLHAMYPLHIRPQETTFAAIVNQPDQQRRIQIAFYASSVFLLVGLLTNLNVTCLHGVYRDHLAQIWIQRPGLRLHEMNTCERGGPLCLFNGTVNRMGSRTDPDMEGCSRFTFSHLFCGTQKLGFRSTEYFQDGNLEVADAVAISGAAVTTLQARGFLQRLLLFLTNFRLGQWVRNPQNHLMDPYWPSPIRALGGLLWYPEQRGYLFVSDGGHLDNTGLSSLLERRCRLMICLDGTADPTYRFKNLMDVFHRSRAKYGIRIREIRHGQPVLDNQNRLADLRAVNGFSKSHFALFAVEYPERDQNGQRKTAVLIHCKLSLTGDEPLELVEMASDQEGYPHDPTTDQFLPPETFEAYTALGRHIADQLDQFVVEGGLDSWDLPLGWTSSSKLKNSRQLTFETANPHEHWSPNEDTEFESESIRMAVSTLSAWANEHHGNSSAATNGFRDAGLQRISAWVRERGSEASMTLRKQFLTGVIQILEQHGASIQKNDNDTNEFYNMLAMLSDRIPMAREAMKSFAEQRDTEHVMAQSSLVCNSRSAK